MNTKDCKCTVISLPRFPFSLFLVFVEFDIWIIMSAADTFEGDNTMNTIVIIYMSGVNCRVVVGWFLWIFPFKQVLLLIGHWKLWELLITLLFLMYLTLRLLVLFIVWLLFLAYAHDIANNERMKRESQEKLEEINKMVKEKGFNNVETICARGEPNKISFYAFLWLNS